MTAQWTSDPLAEPARIAFAGDWHANAWWAERAIADARTRYADVVVHLGDFGYLFTDQFLGRVSAALAEAELDLLFVDGNHENHPKLLRYPIGANGLRRVAQRVWHLPRGFRWQWAGVRFLALGGAHSVDRPHRVPGVSWWKEETITPEQARHAIDGGAADVLVSHDCPAGVPIPGLDDGTLFPWAEIMRSDEHRGVLRDVAQAVRPRLIWHGHYHRRYDATADFGYGPVRVCGLDCDGTRMEENVQVVALADIAAP